MFLLHSELSLLHPYKYAVTLIIYYLRAFMDFLKVMVLQKSSIGYWTCQGKFSNTCSVSRVTKDVVIVTIVTLYLIYYYIKSVYLLTVFLIKSWPGG